MIQNDSTRGASLKEIRKREAEQKDAELRLKCEALATERYGAGKLAQWRKENKGIWFLPMMDEDGNIEALAIMKPINRHILSFASTKITDEGLYSFLEQCMRETWLDGDDKILEDDDYFIPASMQFNKILEGKKANLLKA